MECGFWKNVINMYLGKYINTRPRQKKMNDQEKKLNETEQNFQKSYCRSTENKRTIHVKH